MVNDQTIGGIGIGLLFSKFYPIGILLILIFIISAGIEYEKYIKSAKYKSNSTHKKGGK